MSVEKIEILVERLKARGADEVKVIRNQNKDGTLCDPWIRSCWYFDNDQSLPSLFAFLSNLKKDFFDYESIIMTVTKTRSEIDITFFGFCDVTDWPIENTDITPCYIPCPVVSEVE